MTRRVVQSSFLALAVATAAGCQSVSWPQFWPFPERELTTYNTPAMRATAIGEFAAKSTGTDTPEQRALTDQLARQIQVEPDPLVREAIIRAIADYRTPLAQQVLDAGLQDQNELVRVACCQKLGERADANSVASLAKALREDEAKDVRIAAAQALGQIKAPAAIQALAVALEDRDPAMQYVGVQSMKSVTGKDYGNDVQVWRQVAAGQTPTVAAPSIAERLRNSVPFK